MFNQIYCADHIAMARPRYRRWKQTVV